MMKTIMMMMMMIRFILVRRRRKKKKKIKKETEEEENLQFSFLKSLTDADKRVEKIAVGFKRKYND